MVAREGGRSIHNPLSPSLLLNLTCHSFLSFPLLEPPPFFGGKEVRIRNG